jgi:hypothetical protein
MALVHQADGNVVLYADGRPIWSTGTAGQPTSVFGMQGDGNLVLYSTSLQPLWWSGTDGHPGTALAVQDDCNVVLYTPEGAAAWTTSTSGCHPPANAYMIDLPGCNSVSWDQVPGNPDLFIGRLTVAGPGACDESQGYKLIVASMDWSTHRLTVVNQDLFAPSQTIEGGYRIDSAYDATLLWAHDELWVTFECAGAGLGASSCMGPIVTSGDQTGASWRIDPARTTLVVAADNPAPSGEFYSASVPKVFAWHGEAYLYYSVVHANVAGYQTHVVTRGIELRWDAASHRFWEFQSNGPIRASDWHSVEVMKPDPGDPLSNQVTDGFGVYTDGPPGNESSIYMTGALGGNTNQSCIASPGGINPTTSLGCYREFIARSATPLGDALLNDYRVADRALPQNGNQYLRRYWDPTFGWSLMAQYLPAAPGTPWNAWPPGFWGYPTDLTSLGYELTHPYWYRTDGWLMNPGERIDLPNGSLQYQCDGNLVL